MPIVRALVYQCCRCGRIWLPKGPNRDPNKLPPDMPIRCPACKSAYWDRPPIDEK